MNPIFELMDFQELVQDIGQNIKATRAARGWSRVDFARASGASPQAIKSLEDGGSVKLITFLRAAKALGMARGVWSSCQALPQTLDELERVELARMAAEIESKATD